MRPLACIAAAVLVVTLVAVSTRPSAAQEKSSGESLVQFCARVGNDDTIRDYSPALRQQTARAFKQLFPDAKGEPDASDLQRQAHYRCMQGKVMVCFIGANLPCSKISTARENRGATAFCRDHPSQDSVPAFATGHDAAYSYRCRNGRAQVVNATWTLDKRGFAKQLWVALPDS
ncbi:hypothetical protein [Bradyrhizobium sp. LHD-71]|uniref:hypothetical protein n=1 Tax=Bradyrhizobium sp. LHD-71 TaxID=3072141 RepID=UPI00280CA6D2|nr:hypothetical protein [Bradyrhizobium sp. LHD-71]MDQ8729168.1 hypothetical protein [Bradyrhizobium sp. LHD-71]